MELSIFELSSCVEGNFYDRCALFDDWSDLMTAMRTELDEDREVMVRRLTMTQAEWDELPAIEGLQQILP